MIVAMVQSVTEYICCYYLVLIQYIRTVIPIYWVQMIQCQAAKSVMNNITLGIYILTASVTDTSSKLNLPLLDKWHEMMKL